AAHHAGSPAALPAVRMAGQHPRAREHDQAHRDPAGRAARRPRDHPAHAAAAVGSVASGGGVAVEEPEDAELDDDEPAQPEEPVAMAPVGSRLADVAKAAALKAERSIIEDTLTQVHWNRRRAAEQLGVSYKTLLNKIKECGISRK